MGCFSLLAHMCCAGPGFLELDPDFVANIRPLVTAAKTDEYDQVGAATQQVLPAQRPWQPTAIAPAGRACLLLRRLAGSHPCVQYAMQSMLDNYGTHYISTVFWGGLGECWCLLAFLPSRLPADDLCSTHSAGTLVPLLAAPIDPPRCSCRALLCCALPLPLCCAAAAVTTQMTASTYSSFKQTDVSVSVAAQVAVVQVRSGASACVRVPACLPARLPACPPACLPACLLDVTASKRAQCASRQCEPLHILSSLPCLTCRCLPACLPAHLPHLPSRLPHQVSASVDYNSVETNQVRSNTQVGG